MRNYIILLFFLALSFTTNAQTFYSANGQAVFYSEVPLHNFTGTSNNLTGQINLTTGVVDFYIDLSTLDTGNGKRDRDMRKTLNIEDYPFAEFFGKMTSDFNTETDSLQEVRVSGLFKIHGKEKQIEVDGTMQMTGNDLQLKANWILNLDDYEIKPPKLLILKVDEEQKIEITMLLKQL